MRHAPIVESPAASAVLCRWNTEADTQAFAQALARRPALRHAYVQLHGDLGAGKTTLVRHLLKALGVTGRVKSPTYTVVEPYEVAGVSIWHFDFYRFNDPLEWEDAGFRDIFASPGLKLAEWPERAAGQVPVADLDVFITLSADESRQVRLVAHTERGAQLLPHQEHTA